MSEAYLILKFAHILGAAVLFGTGLGIAFFMLMAHRSGNPAIIAHVAGRVVLADMVFTATAVILQPLTGAALIVLAGHDAFAFWIVASIALYVLTGACWLPVVWMQARMRDLARTAAETGGALPQRYHRLYRLWFALGWPAFAAVIGIFALMVWRPTL